MSNGSFEPRLIGFLCNWCSYTGADLAGTARMAYAPNMRIIRVMCSGRVDPQFVLKAFSEGADGVLISGCHPGDCHYQEGNYKALRRHRLLTKMLEQFGIEKERFRLEWISAAAERNILGVIGKVGLEIGGKVIRVRRECRDILNYLCGKVIHPVCGLPGGVSKGLDEEHRVQFLETAKFAVEFAQFALQAFDDIVLKNKEYVDVVVGDAYKTETYYMGLVDKDNKVNFYDGDVRVVNTEGKEFVKFKPRDYLDHIAEHVESWSYIKFPFLKKIGWKGFIEGKDTSIYRVAPLARLNASDGMATPLAQEHYERMYKTLGGKPVHNTLAFHWARLIESLQAAETMVQILEDKDIADLNIRNIPTEKPDEGVGVVEAPRGILIHHYKTDASGIVEEANLIVATTHNSAAIAMSIEKAAKAFIKGGKVSEGLLNMAEMAFRAYDPCHACGTHALPGDMPLILNIYDKDRELVKQIKRD